MKGSFPLRPVDLRVCGPRHFYGHFTRTERGRRVGQLSPQRHLQEPAVALAVGLVLTTRLTSRRSAVRSRHRPKRKALETGPSLFPLVLQETLRIAPCESRARVGLRDEDSCAPSALTLPSRRV